MENDITNNSIRDRRRIDANIVRIDPCVVGNNFSKVFDLEPNAATTNRNVDYILL